MKLPITATVLWALVAGCQSLPSPPSTLRVGDMAADPARSAPRPQPNRDAQIACEPDQTDFDLISEIDKENEGEWQKKLVIPPWLSPMTVIAGGARPAGFSNVCEGNKPCEVPVLVRKVGNGCQAVVPYYRYCVRKDAQGVSPTTVVFRLAEETPPDAVPNALAAAAAPPPPAGWRWLDAADGYEFVDTEPRIRNFRGGVRGLHIYTKRAAGPVADYFTDGTRSADALSYTWTVGKVNTVGDIAIDGGRKIRWGVLSAAFVRPAGGGIRDICLPRDPIIVNVAN